MPRHFVHLNRTNNPSNALQRAAAAYLEKLDGLIIGNPSVFIDDLDIAIRELNGTHLQCSPLKVNSWPIGKGWGISLDGKWTVGFYLYEIKEAANA